MVRLIEHSMDLKEIFRKLDRMAFTMPGIEKRELVYLEDVKVLLGHYLSFYEQEGSVLVHFPDGKVVEKTNSDKERVIAHENSVKTEEEGLPPEILANLDALQPGAVDEHSSDSDNKASGETPAGPGNG